jgi:UDP-2,4-diacetamido-2,4,6-trideoxy-beta-L-altropyranose hydrolase
MIAACDKTLTVAIPSAHLDVWPYLWIRTTAGPKIGFGHLRRCLILARSLQDCSTPLFILDSHDRWSRNLLAEQGYEFCCEELREVWSLFSDPSAILIDTRRTKGLNLLIARARNRGIPVISIHDLGLNPLPSDVVIDGSVVPGSCRSAFDRNAEVLQGADYMILDPILQQLHQKKRQIRKKIQSVVVNLGGGDSQAFFPKILEGLKRWAQELTVVGLKGFVHWGQDRLERMDWHPVRFRWENADPYPFLLKADVAITAGGLSAYEALCAGTPLLALSYDPLQQTTIRAFADAGACIDLGPGSELDPLRLSKALACLDADWDSRLRLSLNGKKMVDGCGASRVAGIIRKWIHRSIAANHAIHELKRELG